jgi:hypothetical protein
METGSPVLRCQLDEAFLARAGDLLDRRPGEFRGLRLGPGGQIGESLTAVNRSTPMIDTTTLGCAGERPLSSRASAVQKDGGSRCACFLDAELAAPGQLEGGDKRSTEELEQHLG